MPKIKVKSKINKVKSIVLKGPILTNSGYGVHCRQVFKSLLKRENIDLYVMPTEWGNTSWILDKDFDNGVVENILFYAKKINKNRTYDESYQVLLPDEWQNIAHKNIGITAGFEADIVKKEWIEHVNKMSHVIVPSEFTRNGFVKTSKQNNIKLKTKIKIINEWYYNKFDQLYDNSKLDILNELEYNDNILLISQITSNSHISDRKNTIKTIKTACEFVKDKDIGVILKINAGKYSERDKQKLLFLIENEIGKDNCQKISLLFGSLTISELNALYSSDKISCFLSGTRAEGWGLPFIEAASCGLPIIATDYSSYKEFLEDDFLKVDYKLITFNHDSRFVDLDEYPRWAEFEEQSMTNNLDKFFKNKEKYKTLAKSRQKIIKQKYNSEVIINNYIEFFENIL